MTRHWLVVLALVTSACVGVAPVTYRLPGTVSGPIGHAPVRDGRARFAAIFCATLAHLTTVAEPWGPCATYLEIPDPAPATATIDAALPAGLRLVLVGGLFAPCLAAAGVTLFQDAAAHLRAAHGVTVDTVPIEALASSAVNATIIQAFLRAHPGPPVLAVGYSQGAGDWLEAIDRYPDVRVQVRALITVAGVVGGTRLADQAGLPVLARLPGSIGLPGCLAGDTGAIASLTRAARAAFLARYREDQVPTFSLVAVAAAGHVSRVLLPSWWLLRAFSLDQDSQVIADEGLVPGATWLGIARADHWAVALPFALITDPVQRRRALAAVDQNSYPRAALLEAIVRAVLDR